MSTESNRILLKHHLEKLRLPTVRREWESVAAACAGEGVAYGDFLLRIVEIYRFEACLLYTSPSPRDGLLSRMPSSA